MALLIFVAAVTLLSLPYLPLISGLFFSLVILLILVLGQVIVFSLFGLLGSFFSKSIQRRENLKKKYEDPGISLIVGRALTFLIVLFVAYSVNPYLLISASAGVLIWWFFEKRGEKKFKELLRKTEAT